MHEKIFLDPDTDSRSDPEGIRQGLRELRTGSLETVPKKAEKSVPSHPLPRKLKPRRRTVIKLTNGITIELCRNLVRVWGAMFVGANGTGGRQVFQPNAVSAWVDTPSHKAPSGRIWVSAKAGRFQVAFGKIKIVVHPAAEQVEVWNARYVDVMLPNQNSVRLAQQSLPEPKFEEEDKLPD